MFHSASSDASFHGSGWSTDGRKSKTFDGQDKAQFPYWQTEVNRILTNLGVSSISEKGQVRFLPSYEPTPDEFCGDTQTRITEELLESPEGAKYRENGFNEGDPYLTGERLGKYMRARALASQEKRKASASILQLIKKHSTLSAATEKAARTHDPNTILRAVELFYNSETFSTCLAIVASLNQNMAFIHKDSFTQGMNAMRNHRMAYEQFFMIFDEKDRRRRSTQIYDLFHFCELILYIERTCGHDGTTLSFIQQHVRCHQGDLLRFDIALFWSRYGDHLAATRKLDDKSDKKPTIDDSAKNAKKAIAWLKDPKISKEKWKSAVNTLGLSENNLKRFRDDKESGKGKKQRSGICFNFQRGGSCKYGDKCKYKHDSIDSESTPAANRIVYEVPAPAEDNEGIHHSIAMISTNP